MWTIGKFVSAVIVTIIVTYALFELRHALMMLYVAIVLAVLFDPVVERLQRVRIGRFRPGRGMATALVSLATAVAIVLVIAVVVPPIMADASTFETQWPKNSSLIFEWIHRHLPFSRSLTAASMWTWIKGALGGHSAVVTIGGTAIDVLTTLLLAIYMSADGPRAFEWMLSLVPRDSRPRLAAALRSGARRMQGWVSGQGLLMLIHGGSALVAFWVIGLPYFLAVGVFAAIINIIPVLGPVLTLLAAGLIAIIDSPGKLLGVVAFYLVYHNTEGIYLQPRIMKSAVGIPGVAVIAALLIGDEVAGFIGMALSVPTAVLLAEMKEHYTA
jgi:predicted PurR-regulated permease PerM